MSCCCCLCHLCGSTQIVLRKDPEIFLVNSAWLSWWWSDSFWVTFKNKLPERIHKTWLNKNEMFWLDIFVLISTQNLLLEEKNNQLFTGFYLVEKMEDSKVIHILFKHRWKIPPVFKIPLSCILKPFPWFILRRQNLVMKINLSKYINVFQSNSPSKPSIIEISRALSLTTLLMVLSLPLWTGKIWVVWIKQTHLPSFGSIPLVLFFSSIGINT